MANKRFDLNWPYIAFVVIAAATGLGFIGWIITSQVLRETRQGLPISGGFNWPIVIAIDLACVLCFLILLWKIYADCQTEITDEAISRLSFFGLRKIRWSEVTDVKVLNGVGYHIHSRNDRIVVSPHAYKNPGLLVAEMMRLWRTPENPEAEPNNLLQQVRD